MNVVQYSDCFLCVYWNVRVRILIMLHDLVKTSLCFASVLYYILEGCDVFWVLLHEKRTVKKKAKLNSLWATLEMEAARSSQKLVTLYKSTRRYILEDCSILQWPSENLNSHKFRFARISLFVTSLPNLMEIVSVVSYMKHADGLCNMTSLLCV